MRDRRSGAVVHEQKLSLADRAARIFQADTYGHPEKIYADGGICSSRFPAPGACWAHGFYFQMQAAMWRGQEGSKKGRTQTGGVGHPSAPARASDKLNTAERQTRLRVGQGKCGIYNKVTGAYAERNSSSSHFLDGSALGSRLKF